MNDSRNALRFLRLLFADPIELYDRVENYVQSRKCQLFGKSGRDAYPESISWWEGLRALAEIFGHDFLEILPEAELRNIESHVSRLTSELKARPKLPFPTFVSADPTHAQLAYLLCRVLEPETVLETGVAYGVTSATILAALHKNGKGTLHSIDLPPIASRASPAHIGIMVPAEYRYRWHLHLGPSKRVLLHLLAGNVGTVDLFLHDSFNIYPVQKMELETVWPCTSSHAAIIVNNIGNSTAFAEFVRKEKVDRWFAIEQQEKRGVLTGVILRSQAAGG